MIKDLLRVALLRQRISRCSSTSQQNSRPTRNSRGKPLDGDTVLLCFAEPSTRTRISFEAAIVHLGGLPAVVGPAELQLGRGETIAGELRGLSFAAGSMGPKVEAACRFVKAGGQIAGIGALADAGAILAGWAGTSITAAPAPRHDQPNQTAG